MSPFFTLIDIDNPYRIRCGERRIFKVEVEPSAPGKCTFKMSLTAPTCFFGGGKKELITEFIAENSDEIRPLEVQLVMMGSAKTTYNLKLVIEAENAEGEKFSRDITVKLNCTNPMTEAEQTVEFTAESLTTLVTPVSEDTDTEEKEDEPVVKTDTQNQSETGTADEKTNEKT